jgi:hypothetical protein
MSLTTHERAEIAQLKADVATLARRLLAHSGAKADVMDVMARNSSPGEPTLADTVAKMSIGASGEQVSA